MLGFADQLLRIDVDAGVLEIVRVKFGRQTEVAARMCEHGGFDPGIVGFELLLQRIERGFGAIDFVLCIQFAHAVDIARRVGKMLLDFGLVRPEQFAVLGLGFELGFGEFGDRRTASA